MTLRNPAVAALAALALLWHVPAPAQRCSARSAGQVAALVELYVSEGCESCRAAERWLSALALRPAAPGSVVAVLLPADAKSAGARTTAGEVLALRERTRRAHRRARLGRPEPLLTPLVLMQGRERGDWRLAAFERALDSIHQRPAPVRLRLDLEGATDSPGASSLNVRAEVQPLASSRLGTLVLYLGAFELPASSSGGGERLLESQVYRVGNWIGPIAIPPGGTLVERRRLPVAAGSAASGFGVVGFVQRAATGEVLQALARPPCSA